MVKDGRCKRIGRKRNPKVGMIADVWGLLKQVIGVSSRETELDAFVISVKYIDHFWLEPLQIAGEHLHRQRRLFSEVNQEIFDRYDADDSPANWRYKTASEITADCLRIADSILSQLRAGHADTALGTTRQLFELTLFLKAIALDKTGLAAKRFQDYDEASYLMRSLEFSRTNRAEYERRLADLQRSYPNESFRNDYGWIVLPDGSKAGSMTKVVEYVVEHNYDEGPEKEFVLRQYKQMWMRLNKWEHISRSASRRKLGVRADEGYLDAHLVEKSKIGLDTPLSLSLLLLGESLTTFAYIAHDLTGKVHNDYLRVSDSQVRECAEAIKQVDPNLIAGDYSLGWELPHPYSQQ